MKVTLKQVGKTEEDVRCYKLIAMHGCSFIYVPHSDRKYRVGDIMDEKQVDCLVREGDAGVIILAA